MAKSFFNQMIDFIVGKCPKGSNISLKCNIVFKPYSTLMRIFVEAKYTPLYHVMYTVVFSLPPTQPATVTQWGPRVGACVSLPQDNVSARRTLRASAATAASMASTACERTTPPAARVGYLFTAVMGPQSCERILVTAFMLTI